MAEHPESAASAGRRFPGRRRSRAGLLVPRGSVPGAGGSGDTANELRAAVGVGIELDRTAPRAARAASGQNQAAACQAAAVIDESVPAASLDGARAPPVRPRVGRRPSRSAGRPPAASRLSKRRRSPRNPRHHSRNGLTCVARRDARIRAPAVMDESRGGGLGSCHRPA